MSWKPENFKEACKRAAGRRAYNKMRRLEHAARISEILCLMDESDYLIGRDLAAMFGVHESTISRDLKFIENVKADFRERCKSEMTAQNFRWLKDARGWEIRYEIRNGVRIL